MSESTNIKSRSNNKIICIGFTWLHYYHIIKCSLDKPFLAILFILLTSLRFLQIKQRRLGFLMSIYLKISALIIVLATKTHLSILIAIRRKYSIARIATIIGFNCIIKIANIINLKLQF